MNKSLIAAALMLSSFTASATIICDFTFEKGNGFEFTQMSSLDGFQGRSKQKVPDIYNKSLFSDHGIVKSLDKSDLSYHPHQSNFDSIYKDWYYDPKGETNIEYEKFFSRRAKFQDEPFLRFQEASKLAPYDPIWVRYYKAKADNCEQVYLRVEETDDRVSKYFDLQDDRINGDINFEWEESQFNVRFVKPFHKLDTWVGKKIYVTPGADRTKWIEAKDPKTYQLSTIPNHSVLTVLGLVRGAFDYHGKSLSPYMIRVADSDNNEMLIPWVPEKILFSDPFLNKQIRDKYKPAIKKGILVFGMNQSEVQLAWGVPQLERDYHIGIEADGAENIKDETYRDDGLLKNYSVYPIVIKNEGKMVAWHYPGLLPNKHFLVFDRNGILKEEHQTYALNKAVIQKVYNAEH
jgi:hypothetical protein